MTSKILVFAVSMILLAALSSGCAGNRITPAQEAISHYKMGLNRMQSGNYEAALYEFNRAIEKDSSNADAHFAAGVVHYKQSNLEAALKEFKKVLSLDPGYADAHNNLGLIYAQNKDYAQAIKEFKAAIGNTFYKSRDSALVNMGIAYDSMGDSEMAAQSFREALLVQPDNDSGNAKPCERIL